MIRVSRKEKKRMKARVRVDHPKATNIRFTKGWGLSYGIWIDFSTAKVGITICPFDNV